ncbi:MAG: MetQ/NlpA family ABC transporter substrate-binding protein [Lachnospiraceae bacterium]|nr:MetQ/NlpA family ABC transporter substrate-binding protein [Lachnospiraceae bacterium]
MKKIVFNKKAAAIIAAAALLVTGCGQSASTGGGDSKEAAEPEAVETQDVEASEETSEADAQDTQDAGEDAEAESAEEKQGIKSEDGQPIIVKIGTTSDENRIWDALNEELAERGDDIKVEWVNVQQTNQVLADGEVDLNSFQHYAYFDANTADLGLDLTAIGETLIVPLNLFSEKHASLDEIPEGGSIAIPEDATNQGRALHVLENAGLIKLAEGVGVNGTVSDIAENPKNIKIVEMEGPELPRTLADVDAAIINCGYATDYGLDPVNDPIYKDEIDFTDPAQHPFINIIAARTEDKDNEVYLEVVDAYRTERVAKAILEVYNNAAIPAFEY